jgi:Family of unknown function (DUF6069)
MSVQDTGVEQRNIWREGVVAGAVAGVVCVLIWVAGNIAGLDWEITQGGQTTDVLIFMPFMSAFVSAMVSLILLWILIKVGRAGWWKPIVGVVGVVSVAQPLVAATETSTGVILALMHLVVTGIMLAMVNPPRN